MIHSGGRNRRRLIRAFATGAVLAVGLTGCRFPVPDREDLESALMKSVSVTMAPKVERAIVTKYKCRVFAYGLPEYGQSTRCDVTYHFVFRSGLSPRKPNKFHRLLLMKRTADGWVALVNEASQKSADHSQ
jgi:hypothetical protein